MFTIEELNEIIETIKQKVFVANANNELEILLDKIGINYPKQNSMNNCSSNSGTPSGKILIIGESSVKKNNIIGMLKDDEFGFDNLSITRRFDFVFEYETLNSYPFNKLTKWNYAAILAGPIPHSIRGREDNSSLLVKLEKNEDGIYPPVIRLMANSKLKITKQNIHDTLLKLIKEGLVEL